MKVIKYQYLSAEFNIGTEEEPVMEQYFVGKTIPYSETNEEIAKGEAYNGEYTIEDDGRPEPDTTTTEDVLNALLGVTV
jgi:hypothetical protein